MQPEAYDPQVEVTLRLMNLRYVYENELDYEAIIVTTLVNHRVIDREIYNQHGEEMVS